MNRFLNGVVVGSAIFFLFGTLLPANTSGNALQRRLSTARAHDLFIQNCARCHGSDGRADTALGRLYQTPNLTDPEWWSRNPKLATPQAMRNIVTKGKSGMPAFGKKLKRAEISALVNYMYAFKNKK